MEQQKQLLEASKDINLQLSKSYTPLCQNYAVNLPDSYLAQDLQQQVYEDHLLLGHACHFLHISDSRQTGRAAGLL